MGYGRRRLLRNLVGSAVVAGVVAFVGLGLPAIDSQIPATQPVSSAQAYLVGAGVTVVPPAGANLDATQTQPGATIGTVLFLVGGVRYAIVVSPFTGTLPQAAVRLRQKITGTRGYQVTGPESSASTGAGVAGVQGMYSSSGRDGRYVVFLDNGVAVEVTIAGNDLDLRPLLPEIERSVQTIRFGTS